MKPALFKSNVSKIALLLGESLKYGGPEIKEAIRSRFVPTITKSTKRELKEIDDKKQTKINIIKEMEINKFKMTQYLKDK